MTHTQSENEQLPGNFTKTAKSCQTHTCFVGTKILKTTKTVKKTKKHKTKLCFCEREKKRKILDNVPQFINESESAVISSLCLEAAFRSHEIR